MSAAGAESEPAADPRVARRGERDAATLFAGVFLGLGAQMAFLPIWLEDLGLDAAEIGALNIFAILVRIVAGAAIPALSDRLGRPGAVMTALAGLGAAAALAHLAAAPDWRLYALTALLAAAYSGLIPLADAHGHASAARLGFSYQRARSVGSFAFLAATFLIGFGVDAAGSDVVLYWIAAAFALAALGAARGAAGFAGDPGLERPSWRAVFAFVAEPRFLLFAVTIAVLQASHGVYYVYGSIHWRALGYSAGVIGALWAWGVLAEIALFLFGRRLMAGISPRAVMAAAGVAAVVRWSAMALDPPLALLAALQTLHAATFAALHLAMLDHIRAEVPPAMAGTAQGVAAAAIGGAAMALAIEAASEVYPAAGGGAYWVGTACALIGLAGVAALRGGRRPDR